ncbi:ArsR family transcriptional regulator [Candidatus Marinimicrobia bacterium MT.SAG.4]|nr:ArsR family transcriptional regulator [Candidatus Marinimicrobia bacterium MT.SAG.4]
MLEDKSNTVTDVCKALGIRKSTLYHYLKKRKKDE